MILELLEIRHAWYIKNKKHFMDTLTVKDISISPLAYSDKQQLN